MNGLINYVGSLFEFEQQDKKEKGENPAETTSSKYVPWVQQSYHSGLKGIVLDDLLKGFRAEVQDLAHHELSASEREVAEKERKVKQAQKGLKDIEGNKKAHVKNEESRLKAERREELEPLDKNEDTLTAEVNRHNEDLDDALTEKHTQVNKGEEKSWLNKVVRVIGISSILFFETPVSWEAVEAFLNTLPLIAMAGGFVIASFLTLASQMIGYHVVNLNKTMAICWSILGIALIMTIIGLRWNIDEHLVFTASLLIVLFGMNILISIKYHTDRPWFDLLDRIRKLQTWIDEKSVLIEAIRRTKAFILDNIKQTAARNVDDLIELKKSEIVSAEDELSEARLKKDSILKHYANYEKEGIAAIKKSHNEGVHQAKSRNGASVLKSLMLVLIYGVSINCALAQYKGIGMFPDMSMSITSDAQTDYSGLFDHIWEDLDISEEGFSSEGVKILIGEIGDNSYPPIEEAVLEEGAHWLISNRKERIENVAAFKRNLKSHIQKVFGQTPSAKTTKIYRPLVHLLNRMQDCNDREIYIFSDLIAENTLINMRAKRYVNDPSLLIKEGEYELLASKLETDAPIPGNLKGTKIIFVCDVNLSKDTIFYYATRFWKLFLESHGASVKITAHL